MIDNELLTIRFNQLREYYLRNEGFSLTNFRQIKKEEFKDNLWQEARNRLKLNEWSRDIIGKGIILQNIINAIEITGEIEFEEIIIPVNFIDWEGRLNINNKKHQILIDIRNKKKYAEIWQIETAFYNFYNDVVSDEVSMNTLIKIIHQKYSLIAYLFFVKNNQIYLPIKPVHFERAFQRLNINLSLVKKCSWENYSLYIAINNYIKEFLVSKGIEKVRLVDAHSFLWLLASYDENTGSIYNFVKIDAEINDRNKNIKGSEAEVSALKYEQELVKTYGFEDEIKNIKIVSNNSYLGYDIISLDKEKQNKYIEVKSVHGGKIKTFNMSKNEIKMLNEKENYYIYLVENAGSKKNEKIYKLLKPDFNDELQFTKEQRNITNEGKNVVKYTIKWKVPE